MDLQKLQVCGNISFLVIASAIGGSLGSACPSRPPLSVWQIHIVKIANEKDELDESGVGEGGEGVVAL